MIFLFQIIYQLGLNNNLFTGSSELLSFNFFPLVFPCNCRNYEKNTRGCYTPELAAQCKVCGLTFLSYTFVPGLSEEGYDKNYVEISCCRLINLRNPCCYLLYYHFVGDLFNLCLSVKCVFSAKPQQGC